VHVEPFTEAGDIAAQYNMVLRKFNDEVTKRETTARDLREARDQAVVANASKSQFLANMSHELRTPLNAIIGFSEVIRDELFGRLSNDRYKDYAADINSSSQHLLALINDILDLSKIEANKFELYEEEVDIVEIIAACDRMLRGRAEQHGVTLDVRVEAGLPRLRADARALRQMILNLMSNAVKFTPESGNVALGAGLEPDGRIALTVSDTGIGISKENLPRALQPFTQIAEDNLVYAAEGTGLGLPLTAALARLHGGSLVIDSVKGEGTTIIVRFPLNRVVWEADRLSA
jgi:Amt family ammonium transporter